MPTFTTNNNRMCLVLEDGQIGLLRIEDAERLQARGGEGYTLLPPPLPSPNLAKLGVTVFMSFANVNERRNQLTVYLRNQVMEHLLFHAYPHTHVLSPLPCMT